MKFVRRCKSSGNITGEKSRFLPIRTSEQFELSGYTEARSKELIVSAFSEPLIAPQEMVRCSFFMQKLIPQGILHQIRFTFVVGGGKLVRSRYPEELPKWVIASLREIGFVEDRSAAETFDSQGWSKSPVRFQTWKILLVLQQELSSNNMTLAKILNM